MRVARISLVFSALFLILSSAQPARPGGQSASSSVSASQLLQQSLAALQGNTPITDVTLTGSARRIAGSDDESGTATLKALAGTGTRLDLSLSSGPRSELRNVSGPEPAGSWSGPDAVSHAISNHNLFTDPGWFPAFAISSLLSAPNAVITYIGTETHDGQAAIHITASQQFPTLSGNTASLMQHLTQTEIFLDPSTNLPAAVAFTMHPDNNALLDIPVEVQFSDYRSVNGAQIPFHVQKFLNNSLLLDLQLQSATLNSGLTVASFQVQ